MGKSSRGRSVALVGGRLVVGSLMVGTINKRQAVKESIWGISLPNEAIM